MNIQMWLIVLTDARQKNKKQMQSRVPTQLGCTVPSHNTSSASWGGGGLHYGTRVDSVSLSPNCNLCYCCWDFFSDVSHIFFPRTGTIVFGGPR